MLRNSPFFELTNIDAAEVPSAAIKHIQRFRDHDRRLNQLAALGEKDIQVMSAKFDSHLKAKKWLSNKPDQYQSGDMIISGV